ncbi:MAG TPA: alpha/beta fold hydrolase [Galbitalea sp.]|jgi:pimeloyl-ACP methyl ester carboxylesterase
MRLHDRQWGNGRAVALLLHGMMGSGESWRRVAPVIAARGYRVIALDLPGHGLSAADPNLTIARAAASVVETATALGAAAPTVAMGHSYGGSVLAAAIAALSPESAIYVDAPTSSRGGWDRDETRAEYIASRAGRTFEALRRDRPSYSDEDCRVEALAATQFDIETAAGLAAGPGGDWTPSAPPASLMVRPSPSGYVSDEDAAVLRARGLEVRDIPGASHSVWYGHFDEFMAVIDDWYPYVN